MYMRVRNLTKQLTNLHADQQGWLYPLFPSLQIYGPTNVNGADAYITEKSTFDTCFGHAGMSRNT